VLKDGGGRSIGTVVSMSRTSVSALTSAGYFVTVRWDGTIPVAQAYYTGAGCTGTAYLNSGGPGPNPLFAKTVVWLGSAGSLAVPTDVGANGAAPNVDFTAATIDNPDCGASAGTRSGWKLVNTSASAVGLPTGVTDSLSTPLSVS
jgi:hypothetical protein